MKNYANLTKVGATDPIFNCKLLDNMAAGHLVKLGARDGQGDYATSAPSAATDLDLVLLAPMSFNYEVEKAEWEYQTEAGDIVRGYVPVKGRVYDFPVENYDTTVTEAENLYVIASVDDSKPKVANTVTGNESVIFKIDRIYTKYKIKMMALRCIKAV